MSLDWWEFYEVKGNLKTITTEIERLKAEVAELRREIEKLRGEKGKG